MVATVRYEIVRKLSKVDIRQCPSFVIARGEGYENESFRPAQVMLFFF